MSSAGKVIAGTAARAIGKVGKSGSKRRKAPSSALYITKNAALRIKELISKSDGKASSVTLGVRTRGCNGLSYTMDYANKIPEKELRRFEKITDKGVTVYVDPKAFFHVVGTTMDYKETSVAAEFVFSNPNESHCCCEKDFDEDSESQQEGRAGRISRIQQRISVTIGV